jgi:putative flippase GtrA
MTRRDEGLRPRFAESAALQNVHAESPARTLVRHPLVRRITGYSAGSVVAVVISEACFAAAYGWGHSGTTWASAAGFVGGAVPNYILNRRWAWRDRRGRNRRQEIVLYMAVAVVSFLVSAVVTHWAEVAARHLTAVRDWQVVLITAAYLGVSAVFFAVKFVIYETVVFTSSEETALVVSAGSAEERRPLRAEGGSSPPPVSR